MPESPNPGQSYEAWIESKAGACPPDDRCYCAEYTATGSCVRTRFEDNGGDARDWPMPSPPPYPADDEDDEAPDE